MRRVTIIFNLRVWEERVQVRSATHTERKKAKESAGGLSKCEKVRGGAEVLVEEERLRKAKCTVGKATGDVRR